jgi:hypothetical protein
MVLRDRSLPSEPKEKVNPVQPQGGQAFFEVHPESNHRAADGRDRQGEVTTKCIPF